MNNLELVVIKKNYEGKEYEQICIITYVDGSEVTIPIQIKDSLAKAIIINKIKKGAIN